MESIAMSHFTAHHLFGQQVLKDAPSQIARLAEMNLSAFCWGLQGADLLYFHRRIDEFSELPTYGKMIHGEKTNTLFTFLAQDLLNHRKCADFDVLLAYYYGFCCHYSLDRKLHPYVFSLQKQIEDAAGDPKHFTGAHWHVEDGIDHEWNDIAENMPVSTVTVEDYYMADKNLRRSIGGLYARILWNVYGIRIQAKIVDECFIDGVWRNDMLYQSNGVLKPHGIMIPQVIRTCPDLFELSVKAAPTRQDCLNLKKTAWYHHGDRRECHDSVIDLMIQAKELALTLLDRSALAVKQGNRHLVTNFDFSRSFVDGKF